MAILQDHVIAALAFGILALVAVIKTRIARGLPLDFDTYWHLYVGTMLRKQNKWLFGPVRVSVFPPQSEGYYGPLLWNAVAGRALLTKKNTLAKAHLINPTIEFVGLLGALSLLLLAGVSSWVVFVTALLYATTPAWFTTRTSGPRHYGATPRLASEVGANLFFLMVFLPLPHTELFSLLAVLAGCYVILSSKFGIQALVFIGPLSALFAWSIQPLLVVTGSFLFASILGRGVFLKQVRTQLAHLKTYWRRSKAGEMPTSRRYGMRWISEARKDSASTLEWWARIIVRAPYGNSVVFVIVYMPILSVFLLNESLVLMGLMQTSTLASLMFPAVMSGFLVFAFTSRRAFLFLGEPERYLNHVAILLCASVASLVVNALGLLVISGLIIYGLLFGIGEGFTIKKLKAREPHPSRQEIDAEIISLLRSLPQPQSVVCVPYHIVGVYRIMMETSHFVFFPGVMDMPSPQQLTEEFEAEYPFFDLRKIAELRSRYGASLLIVNWGAVDSVTSLPFDSGLQSEIRKSWQEIFSRGDIRVYGYASPAAH